VLQYLTVLWEVLCCAVLRCAALCCVLEKTEQRKKESARTYLIKSIQKSQLKLFSCNPPRWVW
jgi:hypothetical protein